MKWNLFGLNFHTNVFCKMYFEDFFRKMTNSS